MISQPSDLSALPSNTRATPPPLPDIGVFALVDYLSLTGPKATESDTRMLLLSLFPDLEPTGKRTQWYGEFETSQSCPGVTFLVDHNTSDRWKIELKGEPLQYIALGGLTHLLTGIDHTGLTCTRIDCTVDLKDPHGRLTTLIQELENDCLAEMVFPARDHMPMPKLRGREVIGKSLYHGEPTSRKVLCLYDKGLQSSKGILPAGQWLRWEARYRDEAAQPVFETICGAPELETIASLARGIIDRITGPSAWILDLLSDTPLAPAAKRPTSNMDSRIRNLKKQVLPGFQAVADQLGITLHEFLVRADLLNEISVSRDVAKHPAVREMVRYFSDTLNHRDTTERP